ncbi:MAG: molybdenum cofactor biosynthesis protein MoaE [Pseudonocardiales bacterium]|nr:MAG: molybdenum cofactor biosynthesis protein MoaE [Pseudonocardiales bacterium]
MSVELVAVSEEPLVASFYESLVRAAASGAVVLFAGVVRDHDGGRSVTALEYSAHPSAAKVLSDVAAEVAADPLVHAVAVGHRVGPLAIGDTALVAAVSAAHRQAAFAACSRLVEDVKARIPVWKRQVFADGTEEWVGSA